MGQSEKIVANPKTIFLADDDPDDVAIFELALQDLGAVHRLQVSSNGQTLIDAIQKSLVTPDLVFLDINMPVKNGMETLAEIRQRFGAGIKVYMLSTASDPQTVISSKALGANGYLCKSACVSELSDALENLLSDQNQGTFFKMGISCHV